MREEWYAMSRTPPQLKDSGFERDEFIDYAVDMFEETLDETFLGEPATLYTDGTLDEETAIHTNINVWGNTPVREMFLEIRHVIARYGHLKLGNYVRYQDTLYLITEPPGFNQIHMHSWMVRCNYTIRWIGHQGKIVEWPCCFGDETRFSPGEIENKHLILPSTQLLLALPKNNDTVRLKRGMRFIIDDFDRAQHDVPQVYSITKPNASQKASDTGTLFKFNMLEDSFNSSTDSAQEMVADYYTNKNVYSLSLITPPSITVELGQSFTIQADSRINNEPSLGVEYESENADVATVSADGEVLGVALGNTQIKVSFHTEELFVDVEIVDVISGDESTARISWVGDLTIRSGSTKTFTVSFFDGSGNPIADIAEWEVFDNASTSIPSYLSVQSQTDTTLQLRCESNIAHIGKRFFIRATGIDSLATDQVEVTVVGLT